MQHCVSNFQSISPGVVKTEFAGRLLKAEDMEKAVESVDDFIPNVSLSLDHSFQQ